MVGQGTNQMSTLGPTHERKYVCMIFKKHLPKVMQTFAHVNDPPKTFATRDKIEPLGSQKVGLENGQLGRIGCGCFVVQCGMKKC